MSNRDHLERNIERLLRAVQPELELPEDKKEEILDNLTAEAEALSSKDSAASSQTPVILRHPTILAATVILMIGILAGATWLSRYIGIEQTEQFATQPKSIIEETITDEKEPDDELIAEDVGSQKAQIQGRLRQIEAMFDTGNIRGLTTRLSDEASEVRIAAANYLAQIGDFDTVGPLLDASKKWTGTDADNPFVNAIYQIMLKMSRQQAEATAAETQEEAAELVKFEFKPQGVLSGLIVDAETGEAIDDAEISLHGPDGAYLAAKTDADGLYKFEKLERGGEYRIRIDLVDYVGHRKWEKMPVVSLRSDSVMVKHFQLAPACVIDIQVVDENGEPVPGVHLVFRSSIVQGEVCGDQFVDKNGMATVGGFEPSETEYLIVAKHDVDGVSEYAPAILKVKLDNPDVVEYSEIVIKKGVTVKGYAEYSDGVPAEGATISAKPDWWPENLGLHDWYKIGSDGSFSIEHVVSGLYDIQFRETQGWFTVSQVKLPLEKDVLMVKVPKVSPEPFVSISGTIEFIGFEGPPSVYIHAWSRQSDGIVYLRPGENKFSIDGLQSGVYRIQCSGNGIQAKVIENVKAPADDLYIELVYAAGPKLKGLVRRADTGQGVRKFKVRAVKLKTLHGSNYGQDDRWREYTTADGEFEFEVAGPGIYKLQVDVEGFALATSDETSTDKIEPIVLEVTTGGSIKGRVVDEMGKPVSMAKIVPLSKAGGTKLATADVFVSEDGVVNTVDGEFLLEHLPAGSETLKVTHPDYCPVVVKDIEVVEGRTTEPIEVVLTSGGTIEGYVYDVESNPQPNVTLYFQDSSGYGGSGDEEAGRLATVVTNADGFYRATGLPEKMCHVRRSSSWSSLGVVRRVILPANGKTFELNFGDKPVVSGQVVIDAKPLMNTRLSLSDADSTPYFGSFQCTVVTDDNGRFVFMGVPARQYAIHYDRGQKRNDWVKIATVDMGTEDIDIGVIGEPMGTILISAAPVDPNDALNVIEVYLQETHKFSGMKAGIVTKPQAPGQPYVVTGILPGEYSVVAVQSNYVTIREPVAFEDGQEELKVSLTIPKGTANVTGRFVSALARSLRIWRSDEKVVAYVNPSDDGTYEIEGLPAGEYSIGNYFIGSTTGLISFSLSEGESKTIDIDTSAWSALNQASLYVQVIGENGVPLTGADVWLEGAPDEIDPVTVSSQGQFFLTEPGDYILHAVYAGYKEAITNIYLEAKDITTTRPEDSTVFVRLERQ